MKLFKFLDEVPMVFLLVVALFFASIPPGQSHLIEKITMLLDGTLARPIDIFDLFMHGTPTVLVLIKGVRMFKRRGAEEGKE